jgi:putative DNA primase/helicase
MYEKLPETLKTDARFLLWKYETRGGRPTKVPYSVNGNKANPTDRSHFSSFEAVKLVLDKGGYDGIGIFVEPRFSAIDIDDCVTGDRLSDLAKDIISRMDSYAEYSPSGKGVRIIIDTTDAVFDKAKYYVNNRRIHVEAYREKKYVTVTGNAICEKPIRKCGDDYTAFLESYMVKPTKQTPKIEPPGSFLSDAAVIDLAMSAANSEKFRKLWNGDSSGYASQSEADLALCSILAFYCGGDADQIDRLMRLSDLCREKWDREDYSRRTIEKAVAGTTEFYKPIAVSTASQDFSTVAQKLISLNVAGCKRYAGNDIGFGRLFADVFKDVARFVSERRKWFVYDGTLWVADTAGLLVTELGKDLADGLLIYASTIHDEEKRSLILSWCKKWVQRRLRDVYIREAQSVYPLSMTIFDRDEYLFNCSNCTVDIRSGIPHEHCPEDYITKISAVRFDPNASYPRWDRFLSEIMSGEDDKLRFLQKTLGYGLTANTRFECMFFYYGETTRNGKGTLVESVLSVMGDYGITVRPESIMQKSNQNSHSPSEDIARLAGIRFANISEPDKGIRLSGGQLKNMTGNDTLNARFLNENSFDFRPTFKMYINTNYLPVITDMTLFGSGRIVIVPFNRHFTDAEQDKGLKEEFRKPEVQSAILNWLIEGYRLLEKEGFTMPASVADAVASYYHDSNKSVQFMEDILIQDPTSEIRTSAVYEAYRTWCYENGCYAENARNFLSELRRYCDVRRKRPQDGGEKTTLLIGYKLKNTLLS